LKLMVTSALFSAVCEIGCFIGFSLMGTQTNLLNYLGILFLLTGVILINR
jgi:multidrug transporter EmrE-like cation transporter